MALSTETAVAILKGPGVSSEMIGLLGFTFGISLLSLADLTRRSILYVQEHPVVRKTPAQKMAPLTEPPPDDLLTIPPPQYLQLLAETMAQTGGAALPAPNFPVLPLLDQETVVPHHQTIAPQPDGQLNSTRSRISAVATIAETLLPGPAKAKMTVEERLGLLNQIERILGKPVGLSLTAIEKEIITRIMAMASETELAPEVLVRLAKVFSTLLMFYAETIKNQQHLFSASMGDQNMNAAIRSRILCIPAGVEQRARAQKQKEEEEVLLGSKDAQRAAKSLVAMSFRQALGVKAACQKEVEEIRTRLYNRLKLNLPELQQIDAILALVVHSGLPDNPYNILRNIPETHPLVIREGVVRITGNWYSQADEIACAFALVYPHTASFEIELEGLLIKVDMEEFYDKRLVKKNGSYIRNLMEQQRPERPQSKRLKAA